ncbi:Uncharacterized protein Rs2_52466 [Raphanus sativus]|nr:Uncharacterized protein Rs2_52466 [Raphanus sativus]
MRYSACGGNASDYSDDSLFLRQQIHHRILLPRRLHHLSSRAILIQENLFKSTALPPPPPHQNFQSCASVVNIRKPPTESNPPAEVTRFTRSESPLMPIPLSPPPPPSKMPAWKLVKHGDYLYVCLTRKQ